MATSTRDRVLHLFLLASLLALLVWSVIEPADIFIWILEAFPAIVALIVLLLTYRTFRLTNLAYVLVWLHAAILIVGSHHTYAEVPLFNWLQDTYDLQRNYYDRVGHLAQGFVPAIVAREILLRTSPLRPGGWLFFLVTCVCLAISAFYELVEWWMSVLTGTAADAFLSLQGDIWDTQWDMFWALVGAVAALLLLSRWHDRALARLGRGEEKRSVS
ncbi:MAG: DUF2238 domain-containing protein [Desulfuromonadales bacterium]|uniref:DUF2238 domain-containing protein n=1 Tax=Desulfuromonas sp. KJ2020 TaxID=2919173 RepID=UPI0020A78DD3|nr:DUF2238 domain-containing protein [Desulfuromonas sp. KJ2020]MCP3177660.1 DUF2238 domain-containing protein [Desulfuromonas sp. KJ2020]